MSRFAGIGSRHFVYLMMLFLGHWARLANAADVYYPVGIATSATGEIYLADRNLPGVWQIKEGHRGLYFEGSRKFRTPLNAVRCLLVDKQGRLIAGDTSTREVYRFNTQKMPEPLTKGGVGMPMALAEDSSGNLFIGDLETHRIYKLPAEGGELKEYAVLAAPRGLAMDHENRLWAVSSVGGKNRIVRFSTEGKPEEIATSTDFQFLHHLVVDKDLNAFVADGYAKTIWKIGTDKSITKWYSGDPLSNPVGLAWLGDKLLVIDPRAKGFLFAIEGEGKIAPIAMPETDKPAE